MAGTVALSKILHVRENEKQDAQKAYQLAVDSFEDTATKLYNLLRKKEAVEELYENSLHKPTSIETIREQAGYMDMLNAQVNILQVDVQHARGKMESKHEELKTAHVEVKKFEKIIEHRDTDRIQLMKKNEAVSMDEISVQQYLSRKIR
ncbi:flagellar export protein FliJ [Virgibacillus kekensis]|uniref:Flagellar FliJ protein n=1 Tax=Virgibacillus kekensis TaxID=202261 RepID=A0ABV9DE96_9BACI